MDTDVVAGLEAGIETALVLSEVTTRADIDRFPFKPDHVIEGLADLDYVIRQELIPAKDGT